MTSNKPITLLALTVLLLLVSFSAAQVTKRTVKTCLLYFANVDDLGWTFSVNVGRLNMKTEIEKKYPNVILDTKAWPNAAFDYPTVQSRQDLFYEVLGEGCEIVISIGPEFFDAERPFEPTIWLNRAKFYTNITFMVLWDEPTAITQREADNIIFFIVDFTPGYYLAGVAAAAQATTCTGIMVPFDWNRNSHDAATGFALGVRDTKPNLPVHIIPMNSFFAPWNELIVSDLLVNNYGCEVISRYSDPRDVDVQIQSIRAKGVMSVGVHADLQQYVGDTVLTSVYAKWDKMFIPIVEDHINFGKIQAARYPAVYGVASGHLVVSPISTAAKPEVQAFVNAAQLAKMSAGTDDVMCGQPGITTNWGVNTNVTYKAGTNCRDVTGTIPGIGLTSNAVFHGAFQQPSNCPNGTKAGYNTSSGIITLQCDICPANTFALTGDRSCTPCPEGLISAGNASQCTAKPVSSQQVVVNSSKDATPLIIGIIVPVGLLLLIAILIVARTRYIGWVKNKRAPKSGPLCLLFTDVEGSTNLWNQSPEAMSVAMDVHHSTIRQVIEEYQGYEVKTVGDAFMIAAPTALDGAIIAVEIQKALHTAKWPAEFTASDADSPWNGLKVRIGVNWCEEVEPKYEAVHNYWDYYGNDVNVSARIESKGQGGQITLSEFTWNSILDDPTYDDLLGASAVVKAYARDVQLKGVEGGFSLYQMVPFSLMAREFPPLEGHEADFNDSESQVTQSENASQASNAAIETLNNKSVNYIFQQVATVLGRDSQRKVFGTLCKEFNVPYTNPKNPRRAIAAVAVETSKKIGLRVAADGLLGEHGEHHHQRRASHHSHISQTSLKVPSATGGNADEDQQDLNNQAVNDPNAPTEEKYMTPNGENE